MSAASSYRMQSPIPTSVSTFQHHGPLHHRDKTPAQGAGTTRCERTVGSSGRRSGSMSETHHRMAHTSLYLAVEEHRGAWRALQQHVSKTSIRWCRWASGLHVALDVFEGPLIGLVLAEIDAGSSGSMPPVPDWLGRERQQASSAFTGHAVVAGHAARRTRLCSRAKLPSSSHTPGQTHRRAPVSPSSAADLTRSPARGRTRSPSRCSSAGTRGSRRSPRLQGWRTAGSCDDPRPAAPDRG